MAPRNRERERKRKKERKKIRPRIRKSEKGKDQKVVVELRGNRYSCSELRRRRLNTVKFAEEKKNRNKLCDDSNKSIFLFYRPP